MGMTVLIHIIIHQPVWESQRQFVQYHDTNVAMKMWWQLTFFEGMIALTKIYYIIGHWEI